MDTKEFKKFSSEHYKEHTKNHWGKKPCGSNYSDSEYMTKEYFEEIEAHRYGTHHWILENINTFEIAGKDVLEIGYGMGTDHLNLARRGATMHGIDITPENRDIVAQRLKEYGFVSDLVVGDAENLPYKDESMDFVYSLGVIHHSPDTEKIVKEIHRVLNPGGKCWIAVYNKNSIFFWWSVFLVDWLLNGRFLKETIKERISRIEHPNDNPNLVIRLYTRRDLLKLFNGFRAVKVSVDQLIEQDILYVGKYMPQKLLRWMAKRAGWYLIVEAKK